MIFFSSDFQTRSCLFFLNKTLKSNAKKVFYGRFLTSCKVLNPGSLEEITLSNWLKSTKFEIFQIINLCEYSLYNIMINIKTQIYKYSNKSVISVSKGSSSLRLRLLLVDLVALFHFHL